MIQQPLCSVGQAILSYPLYTEPLFGVDTIVLLQIRDEKSFSIRDYFPVRLLTQNRKYY